MTPAVCMYATIVEGLTLESFNSQHSLLVSIIEDATMQVASMWDIQRK